MKKILLFVFYALLITSSLHAKKGFWGVSSSESLAVSVNKNNVDKHIAKCEKESNARSCAGLLIYFNELGDSEIKVDLLLLMKAKLYGIKSCSMGVPRTCIILNLLQQKLDIYGRNAMIDEIALHSADEYRKMAYDISKEACEEGEPSMCGFFSYLHEETDEAVYKEYRAKNLELGKKSCDNGNATECIYTASLFKEDVLDKDKDIKSPEYHELKKKATLIYINRAKNDKTEDIYEYVRAADAYLEGKYVKRDVEKYFSNLVYGCIKGSGEACVNFAKTYTKDGMAGENKDIYAQYMTMAVDIFTKGCEKGESKECRNMAEVYGEGKFLGKNDEMKKRYEILERFAIEKECNDGIEKSCSVVSMLYKYGMDGREKNTLKAALFSARGCKSGGVFLCDSIANILER